jgi:hypothetical protein
VPECNTPGDCEHDKVREGVRVIVRLPVEEEPSPGSEGDPEGEALFQQGTPACPDAEGPHCLPLAEVTLSSGAVPEINVSERRSVVHSNQLLFEFVLNLAERVSELEAGS